MATLCSVLFKATKNYQTIEGAVSNALKSTFCMGLNGRYVKMPCFSLSRDFLRSSYPEQLPRVYLMHFFVKFPLILPVGKLIFYSSSQSVRVVDENTMICKLTVILSQPAESPKLS